MLVIDDEFRSYIPVMSDDERRQLEENLVKDGCLSPLVTWGDILLDGHNRYEICTRRGIPFTTTPVELADRTEAMIWIINHQLGRRNITDFVRVELALKLEPLIAAKAKEKQVATLKQGDVPVLLRRSTTGTDHVSTRDEVAKAANVSPAQIHRVKAILKLAPEETHARLREGKTTINAVYQGTGDEPGVKQMNGEHQNNQPLRPRYGVYRSTAEQIVASARHLLELASFPSMQVSTYEVRREAEQLVDLLKGMEAFVGEGKDNAQVGQHEG